MSGQTCAIRKEFPKEIFNNDDMVKHAKDSARYELGMLLMDELSKNQGKKFAVSLGEDYLYESTNYHNVTYEARIIMDSIKEQTIYHYDSRTIPQQIKDLIKQWYNWKRMSYRIRIRTFRDTLPSRVYNVCIKASEGFYGELLS